MKKIILTLFLITEVIIVLGLDGPSSKIIIYRESSYHSVTLSYKILLNNSMIIKLRNNTYYEYHCFPGQYVLGVENHEKTKVTIDVKDSEIYYLKLELKTEYRSVIPELVLIDSMYAKQTIRLETMNKLSGSNDYLQRPHNRIGMRTLIGIGMENTPMSVIVNGAESKICFGGCTGIGLSYGREINRYFDVDLDFNYASSCLPPDVENAQITFSRISTKITPSVIFPIDGGFSMRLKLGVGFGYYWNNNLDLELCELQDGFDDIWHYENTFGPHARLIFEFSPSETISFINGISYSKVTYAYEGSNDLSYPTDDSLIQANGSFFNLIWGMNFNF